MKPIPKAPRAPLPPTLQSPIEKAVADLMKNVTAQPASSLLTASKPEVEAALKKAWEQLEHDERQRQVFGHTANLNVGRPKPTVFTTSTAGQPIPAGMVQTYVVQSQLERQLEESLWALATLHTPVFEQKDLDPHLGPGHLEGDRVIKRVFDKHVLVLCPCNMMLEMNHCEGPPYAGEGSARCQNFVVGQKLCSDCRGLL